MDLDCSEECKTEDSSNDKSSCSQLVNKKKRKFPIDVASFKLFPEEPSAEKIGSSATCADILATDEAVDSCESQRRERNYVKTGLKMG